MKKTAVLGLLLIFISFSLGLQFSFNGCKVDGCCKISEVQKTCCGEKDNCCETTTIQLDKITDNYLPVTSGETVIENACSFIVTIFHFDFLTNRIPSSQLTFFATKAPPPLKISPILLFRKLLI